MCDRYLISPPDREVALEALGLPSFCGCEICEAGGSCIRPPFAGTMRDLVERIKWRNVAVALKALGVVVSLEEAGPIEEAAAWRPRSP